MPRTMLLGLLLLVSMAPTPALGSHFTDFSVVPVAGHGPGLSGSMWQSDVIIHNLDTVPLTVEIGLVDSGLAVTDNFFPVSVDGATTVTIPAGATRLITDLLRNHRGRSTSMGALLIGGDRPFAVTTRTYHVSASGATIAQTVPGAEDFVNETSPPAAIPGLIANANFRTNIGVVAAANAGAPLVVDVALLDSTGTSLGTRTLTLPAGALMHTQFSTSTITTTPFDIATARLRIVSGSGDLTGYASVIDNRSNGAAFVNSGFAGGTASAVSAFASALARLRDR